MRRLPHLLACLAALAAGLLVYKYTRDDGWRRLPGGEEVRLQAVTYEKEPHIEVRAPLFRRLFMGHGSLRERLSAAPMLEGGYSLPKPVLVFWFLSRGPYDALQHIDVQAAIIMSDGQKIDCFGSMHSEDSGILLHSFKARLAPRADRRLHLQVTKGGEALDFDVPNPCYSTDFPVWKAEPLPQKRTVNGVGATLRSLQTEVINYGGGDSRWSFFPEIEYRFNGVPIDGVETRAVEFSDPLGNSDPYIGIFSQPVWKVSVAVDLPRAIPNPDNKHFAFEFFVKPPAPPVGR